MSFDDLKTYEAFRFLMSVEDGRQRDPSLSDILAAAQVLAAIEDSIEHEGWKRVAGRR